MADPTNSGESFPEGERPNDGVGDRLNEGRGKSSSRSSGSRDFNSDRPTNDASRAADPYRTSPRRPDLNDPDNRYPSGGRSAQDSSAAGTPRSNRPDPRTSSRRIAASQALVTRRDPAAGSDSRERGAGGYRTAEMGQTSRRYSSGYGDRSSRSADYGGGYGGGNGSGYGGGYGTSPSPEAPAEDKRTRSRLITFAVAVALVSFFCGYALRDIFSSEGGFDDERPIQAEQVPPNLRGFCVSYDGYPSFTLVTVASTSALTATTVPVVKLDTCTIPTRQTANALQALGVDRRAESIGLQLGGSNLTLVNFPLTDALATQLIARYPILADSLDGSSREAKEATLENALYEMLQGGAGGLSLQNVIKTNQPGVYAIAPGHTFNLQPQLQPSSVPR